MKLSNLLILTGAGFTKNFGGLLSNEMWVVIFNNPLIQDKPKLKELLLNNFNFEDIYSSVMGGNYTQEEKIVFQQAIEDAYKELDDLITHTKFDNSTINIPLLSHLIALPINRDEQGLFFTLNQDIFVEKKLGRRSPGAQFDDAVYGREISLDRSRFITLPSSNELDNIKREFNKFGFWYIKLHGSYGWLSHDGTHRMAIGNNKLDDIQREPLLKWYFEVFHQAITEGDKKLLVIGYGFRDEHINKTLLEGVNHHNLTLYVISPENPYNFHKNIEYGHAYAMPLWLAIRGYFPYTMQEIFPPGERFSYKFERIKSALLG
jgi:hypothetical protein